MATTLSSPDIPSGGSVPRHFEFDGWLLRRQPLAGAALERAPAGTRAARLRPRRAHRFGPALVRDRSAGQREELPANAGAQGGALLLAGARQIRNDMAPTPAARCPLETRRTAVFTVHASVERIDVLTTRLRHDRLHGQRPHAGRPRSPPPRPPSVCWADLAPPRRQPAPAGRAQRTAARRGLRRRAGGTRRLCDAIEHRQIALHGAAQRSEMAVAAQPAGAEVGVETSTSSKSFGGAHPRPG